MTLLPLRLIAGAAIAFSMFASAPALAAPFSALFVVGDSLSDSGNNASNGLIDPTQVVSDNSYIAISSYASGTYSNGPVWASYLAERIGVPLAPSFQGGTNFANGGARTGTPGPLLFGYPFSLKVQAGNLVNAVGGNAPASALYVVAGGGNDVRDLLPLILQLDLTDPAELGQAIALANAKASAIASDLDVVLDTLRGAGAQNIVLWNLPDLGLVPAAGTDPSIRTLVSDFIDYLNGRIALELGPQANVIPFDLFGFGAGVVANAGPLGLTNVSDACGAAVPTDPQGCSGHVWWDGIHPTTRTHELIALALAELLEIPAPVPAPHTILIFAGALAGLMVAAHRGTAA